MRQIKGLLVDLNDAEGDLKLPKEFLAQDGLTQADILKDWLGCIKHEYNAALLRMRAQYENITLAACIKKEKAEVALVREQNRKDQALLVGKTISAASTAADGSLFLYFTDGTRQAIYHPDITQPVQVSHCLTVDDEPAPVAA